jgi:predicted nucleic acid-binding Zn ribbon protein
MNDSKRGSNEEPLKEVLDRWLKAHGFERKLKEMDVIAAWPELMGPAVAHRTTEIRIKDNILYLKLDSSVMREELQQGKSIIIQRLNEFAGIQLVKDIWFG